MICRFLECPQPPRARAIRLQQRSFADETDHYSDGYISKRRGEDRANSS
jgi:hypothetical protein